MAKLQKIEEIFTRLEVINGALSDEALPLDQAMKLYAEGAELVAGASKKLDDAQLKIEEISLQMDQVPKEKTDKDEGKGE